MNLKNGKPMVTLAKIKEFSVGLLFNYTGRTA